MNQNRGTQVHRLGRPDERDRGRLPLPATPPAQVSASLVTCRDIASTPPAHRSLTWWHPPDCVACERGDHRGSRYTKALYRDHSWHERDGAGSCYHPPGPVGRGWVTTTMPNFCRGTRATSATARWRAVTLAAVLVLLTIGVSGVAAAAPGQKPRVLTVGTFDGKPGEFQSIQAAVDTASPGDWIVIAPGDYKERGDYTTHPPDWAPTAGVFIDK